jgi:hypothetical protein
MKTVWLPFFVFFILVFAGCNRNVKTEGTVKFSDGELITTGYVYFSNGQTAGRGEIQSDGTYSTGMLKSGEGLPPGQYKIYFSGGPMDTSTNPDGISIIDPKYFTYAETPLSVNITDGKTESFDIIAERNPAVKK